MMKLLGNNSYLYICVEMSYEKGRFIPFSSKKQKHDRWQNLPKGGLALNKKESSLENLS